MLCRIASSTSSTLHNLQVRSTSSIIFYVSSEVKCLDDGGCGDVIISKHRDLVSARYVDMLTRYFSLGCLSHARHQPPKQSSITVPCGTDTNNSIVIQQFIILSSSFNEKEKTSLASATIV
jgi:hypothetical protein